MVKKTILKIALSLLILVLILNCSKEELTNLKDTLYVRHKGADMPAHIYGNASENTFLIILHGGPGGTGLTYRVGTIKSKIEEQCAVIYFDQRGAGNSQGQFPKENFTIDIMAEDILALVKVIKSKYGENSKFFLMGHSWGGTLGSAVLLEDQTLFEGWIEVDGAHDPKGLYFEYLNNFRRVATQQIELGNNTDYWSKVINKVDNVDSITYSDDAFFNLNREAFASENILHQDNLINFNEDISKELLRNSLFRDHPINTLWNNINSVKVLATNGGIFETLSYSNRLDGITIPSLVLWGKYDMVVPPVFAQNAYDNLGSKKKELVIFEHSGHSPMFEEPNLFADKVIEFINQTK